MAEGNRAERVDEPHERAERSRSAPSVSERAGRTLYDADFYTWTCRQADLLRQGKFDDLDVENIVEEIETLGRSERSSLRSAYRLIALHLLKRMFQPHKKTRSWSSTIGRERDNVELILDENPGLRPQRVELFKSAYALARKEAARETGLAIGIFPVSPPFTVDEAEKDSTDD